MMKFLLALGAALAFATTPGAPAPNPLPAPASRTVAEADSSLTLIHEIEVDAPAADIWTAVSTAQGWQSWAVPLARMSATDPDLLETSYNPASAPGAPDTIRQRFVARIPGRMLAFRTVKAPAGFPDFEIFAKVTHVFELVPLGERRTLVRLTGTGYANNEAGRRLLGFFDHGNRVSLESLRARFAEGPVDWNKKLGRTPE